MEAHRYQALSNLTQADGKMPQSWSPQGKDQEGAMLNT